MNTYMTDADYSAGIIRRHPWTVNHYNSDEKYYDFRANPDLIPLVLEDFKPWADTEAIKLFYEFLSWLNQADSRLESNDCRFRGPKPNEQKAGWPKELVCSGEILFFYENLQLNLSSESAKWIQRKLQNDPALPPLPPNQYIVWLTNACHHYLKQINSNFVWGCVEVFIFPTFYLDVPLEEKDKFGHEVGFKYWAWGDDETDTMNNLYTVVATIFESLQGVSAEIIQSGG